jgi:hypothetical protein
LIYHLLPDAQKQIQALAANKILGELEFKVIKQSSILVKHVVATLLISLHPVTG